jgi:hypothetical protein
MLLSCIYPCGVLQLDVFLLDIMLDGQRQGYCYLAGR